MLVITAIIVLIIFLITGIPVPFAFFASTLFMIIFGGYDPSFLIPFGYYKESTTVLLAIPLFIMAGGLIERGHIGNALIGFIEMFLGRIKGYLGPVMVVSSAVFGAITGSATATMSVMGSILLPQMERKGYDKGKSSAILANCALIGGIIPPSSLMILYAWVAQQSVLACFLAGLIPGIILTTLMAIVASFLNKDDLNIHKEEKTYTSWGKEFGKRTWHAVPALLMPVFILGSIYGGIMTPTEAAGISVLYALPVGLFIYKGLNKKEVFNVFVKTSTTTGVIMVMLFTVMIFSRILVLENVPSMLVDLVTSLSSNKYIILIMINVFLLIIGMLMDDVSATLLSTPMLLPLITQLGIDPIQFAAMLLVNLSFGCVTPPCAPLLYLGGRLGEVSVNHMMKPTLKFALFAWLPTLILVTYIPTLSTFLPNLILGK